MTLVDVEFSIDEAELPEDVTEFLAEADTRLQEFLRTRPTGASGFAPCDFVTMYRALRSLAGRNLATGSSFCEWGSGIGVVASLASMLEFQAHGIEIDRDLVDASLDLADDFDLDVELVHGSFVPRGSEAWAERALHDASSDFVWLVTESDNAYDELGLDVDDFDIIFAYPWPGEEHLIDGLFDKHAAVGALLLTYSQFDSVLLRRKVRSRR